MIFFSIARFKTRSWAFFLAAAIVAAASIQYWKVADADDAVRASLEDYLRESDTEKFKSMGPQGIRFLTHILEHSLLTAKIDALVARLPSRLNQWIPSTFSSDESSEKIWDRRNNAKEILCGLGPDAASAAPTILKVLQNPASDQELKQNCLEILGAIGPKSRAAVPTILAFTTNDDFTAQTAALALWKIDRETNAVVVVISNRLRFAGRDRKSVLPYFESMGRDLAVMAPLLRKTLFDEDETIRGQAEQLLGLADSNYLRQVIDKSNRDAGELLRSHLAALASMNRAQRINALEAMAVFGPAATNAVPPLVLRLETLDQTLETPPSGKTDAQARFERDLCLKALAEIGTEAETATPELVRLLNHPRFYPGSLFFDETELAVICRCLGRIGPGAAAAAPVLTKLLTNSTVLMADGLRHNRKRDSRWASLLMRNTTTAITTVSALAQIAPNDSSLQAALRLLQTNHFGAVTIPASVALWRLGLETNLPLEELITNFDTASNPYAGRFGWSRMVPRDGRHPMEVRYVSPIELKEAIDLLGDIGPAAHRVLPELEEHLAPTDPLRRNAAIAIQKIDPAAAQKLGLPGLLIVAPK